MTFLPTVARTLLSSVKGDPWHGASLDSLVSDLTAAEAARHLFGAHSILELVLHVAVWVEETASRLEGHPPVIPAAGDWPAPSSADPKEAWGKATAWLARASDRLQPAVAAFPEGRLTEVVGGQPDSPPGSDLTFGAMLIGLAEHNAYHAGQIALLKRAVRAPLESGLEAALPVPRRAGDSAAVTPPTGSVEESVLDAARRHIGELAARAGLGEELGAGLPRLSKPSRDVADAQARAELEALRAKRARGDRDEPDEAPPLKKTL